MDNRSSATLMTSGPIWKKIIAFAVPLFFGNLFQQLYNTADSLIVGNYLGSSALAAVSSSGNLFSLWWDFSMVLPLVPVLWLQNISVQKNLI